MLKLLKSFGPLHFFTAGGLATFAVLRGIKFVAARSNTVENTLQKGFDFVEDKIDDLKGKVLPDEGKESVETR